MAGASCNGGDTAILKHKVTFTAFKSQYFKSTSLSKYFQLIIFIET